MRNFVDKYEMATVDEREALAGRIATRSRSADWRGVDQVLPDPDPVLQKTGQDLRVYRELMADAHVWSCCQSRKSGTLSCEWEIREGRRKGASLASRRAFQVVSDLMAGLDVNQAVSDLLESVYFGISPVEVIWKPGKLWLPEQLVGRPPEWFAFDDDNNLRFLSRENQIYGEVLPDKKFLLARHHADYLNPYGQRTLSRCFWPVVFKRGGFKFWAIFTEKFGMPWPVGKVPKGTNEAEREEIYTALARMVQDAVCVINDDQSVELLESAGKSASAGIYEALISAANREISKAILGQTLTTELDKGGSHAAAQSHLEVRQDLVDQDKRLVQGEFNRLFHWVVDLNFPGTAPPEFHFFQAEDVRKDLAERDETLTRQGLRLSRGYYQRAYNLGDEDLEEKGEAAKEFAERPGKKIAATRRRGEKRGVK
ncbi:MAG: DUF935 family protein [Pseudomonadota bacterium]